MPCVPERVLQGRLKQELYTHRLPGTERNITQSTDNSRQEALKLIRCMYVCICMYETRSKLPVLNCRLAVWCDAKTPKNDRGRPKYDNHS